MSVFSRSGGGGALRGEIRRFVGPTAPAGWSKVAGEPDSMGSAGTFALVPSFTGHWSAAATGQRLHIIGPAAAGMRHQVYDSLTGSWSPRTEPAAYAAPYAGVRPGAFVALPDGRLFMASFGSTSASRSAAIYDPELNAWTSVADMPVQSRGGFGVLLTDGRVLVVETTHSFIYDTAANAWSADMAVPTALSANLGLGLVVLPSGDVLAMRGNKYAIFSVATQIWGPVLTQPLPVTAGSVPVLLPSPEGALCYAISGASPSAWQPVIRFTEATGAWDQLVNIATPASSAWVNPAPFPGGGWLLSVGSGMWFRLVENYQPVGNCFAAKD